MNNYRKETIHGQWLNKHFVRANIQRKGLWCKGLVDLVYIRSKIENMKTLTRTTFVFSILFFTSLLYGQKKVANTDSIYFEGRIGELTESNAQLGHKLSEVIAVNDSLNKELFFYRVKEDYFSVALETQAGRFGTIISIAFGLLAFVSFGGFWLTINRIKKNTKKQILKQKIEFDKQKSKLMKMEAALASTSGNNFTSIAQIASSNGMWGSVLTYSLNAARDHAISLRLKKQLGEKNIDYFVVTGNLQIAISMFEKMAHQKKSKQSIVDDKEQIIKGIEEFRNIDNEEVKDLAAKFRVELKKYLAIEPSTDS